MEAWTEEGVRCPHKQPGNFRGWKIEGAPACKVREIDFAFAGADSGIAAETGWEKGGKAGGKRSK